LWAFGVKGTIISCLQGGKSESIWQIGSGKSVSKYRARDNARRHCLNVTRGVMPIPADGWSFSRGSQHSWAIRQHCDNKLVTENYKGFEVVPGGALGIATIARPNSTYRTSHPGARSQIMRRKCAIDQATGRQSIRDSNQQGQLFCQQLRHRHGHPREANKPDYNIPRSLKPRVHFDLRRNYHRPRFPCGRG
jgi:hypothetical protein